MELESKIRILVHPMFKNCKVQKITSAFFYLLDGETTRNIPKPESVSSSSVDGGCWWCGDVDTLTG